jgi:hypothetical protein
MHLLSNAARLHTKKIVNQNSVVLRAAERSMQAPAASLK